jgi:hypothetical protein
MTSVEFNNILVNPNQINTTQTNKIEDIIEAYPYFQTARILYLKGLQKQNSFKFNSHLKKTAAYCTDRTVLFDFIVSKKSDDGLEEAINSDLSSITKLHENIGKPSKSTLKIVADTLDIGKPITFSKKEKHSFDEWLQLENFKPVERKAPVEKFDLIENFIKSNPKIKPIKKVSKSIEISASIQENPAIMTETLAKVYLEQKKYDKVLQAYKILSLKYPEKSSFFADRIKAIKFLQKHNIQKS